MATSEVDVDDWQTISDQTNALIEQVGDLVRSDAAGVRVLGNLDQRVAINTTLLGKILRAVDPEQQPSESGLEDALKAILGRLDHMDTTLGRLTAAVEAVRRV